MSSARMSVSLPLPSSPHWVPTTTVPGTWLETSRTRLQNPPECGGFCRPRTTSLRDEDGLGVLAEDDLAALRVDHHRVALGEAALEEGQGQRVGDGAGQEPLERPGPEHGVVPH